MISARTKFDAAPARAGLGGVGAFSPPTPAVARGQRARVDRPVGAGGAGRPGVTRSVRASWREPARWQEICLAWWTDGVLHGVGARLITIGPRSAVAVTPAAPPVPRALRFCLDGFGPGGWVRARVAELRSDPAGLYRVRLIVLPDPCPADLLLAAVRGEG